MNRILHLGVLASLVLALNPCGDTPLTSEELAACAPPTYDSCVDPQDRCARHFHDQAASDANAACNILIKQAAQAGVYALPSTHTTIKPDRIYGSGFKAIGENTGKEQVQVTQAAIYKVGARDQPVSGKLTAQGFTGSYMGRVRNAAVNLTADPTHDAHVQKLAEPSYNNNPVHPPTVVPHPGTLVPYHDPIRAKRDAWEANGNTVDSCEEYVYEKYYDYTRFEDAAARAGLDNPRQIYNVAYGSAQASTSLGTLGVQEEDRGRAQQATAVTGRNGVPAGVSLPVSGLWPKNDFYSVPRPAASQVLIQNLPGHDDGVSNPVDDQVVIILGHMHRRALNFAGVEFDDADLTAIIDGTPEHPEDFRWHKDMAARNAPVLDDLLYDFDLKKASFLLLLKERHDVTRAIAASLTSKGTPMAGVNKYQTRWWLDPIWNPDPTQVQVISTIGVNVLNANNGNPYAVPGAKSVLPFSDGFNQPTLAADSRYTLAPQLLSACGPDANPLICLFYRLEAVDDAIEAALQDARETGCVTDPNTQTTGPQPCDWSPQTFASRMLLNFAQEREADFQRCEAATEGDFAGLKDKTFKLDQLAPDGSTVKVDFPDGVHDVDYTVSPQQLELYFQRLDDYGGEVLKFHHAITDRLKVEFPKLLNPKTQALQLRRVEGDTYKMGGKWFGAQAHWETGFEVLEIGKPNECEIRQHVWGDFTAKATVLLLDVDLVDAHLNVTDEKLDRLNLTVAGEELIDPKIDASNAIKFGASYDLVAPGGREKTNQFAHYTQNFVIVFIPVSLGAYASGTLGFKYSVTAGREEGETTQHKCKIARAVVRGSIEPYARVDGEIRAAVDVFVASAGMKGVVHVVRASVPVTAEASIGPNKDDPAQYDIQMRAGAELKMDFLSGEIDAYAEAGICPLCDKAQATLIAWKGIQTTVPLFNIGTTVPLFDLRQIAGVTTDEPAALIAVPR